MKARLAFAVSVNIDPDILILDEVLAVGDELFKRKSYAKMEDLFKSGKTIIFVSHSINTINQLCPKSIYIKNGKIEKIGISKEITALYQKELFENTDYAIKKQKTKEKNVIDKQSKLSSQFFLKNFTPKSTSVTDNGFVENLITEIRDKNNERVNILQPGETYFHYSWVKFRRASRNVNFSFAIKTEKGVLISYGFSTLIESKMFNVNTGDIIEAKWTFKNRLGLGNYYTNIGVRSYSNGERSFLHRITDADAFKVISREDENNLGMVDLSRECSVTKKL